MKCFGFYLTSDVSGLALIVNNGIKGLLLYLERI